ncbi:hypothetical protein L6R49_25950 [Myxococcota bacterium]|nr:hypothetical protein [Myxococcota bacterium]
MSEVERGLRRALLALAGLTGLGLVGELLLIGHTEEALQLAPVTLGGLTALGAAWAARAPESAPPRPLRALSVVLVITSAIGVWEHLESNLEFERELRPTQTTVEALIGALSGSSPLLAPGALVVAALALAAAVWRLTPGSRAPGAA